MNKKTLIVIICVALIAVCIGLIYYNFFTVSEVRKLEMHYEVSDRLGFNVDTDAIYFGKGLPGSQAKRDVDILNSYNFDVNVNIKLLGPISVYVSVSDNDFVLHPNESKRVSYYLQTSPETPYQNLSGMTLVKFSKA